MSVTGKDFDVDNMQQMVLRDMWNMELKKNFLKENFRVLSEMRGKFCTTTLKISKNHIKINQNAAKMPSNFKNRPLKTLSQILKSVSQNP